MGLLKKRETSHNQQVSEFRLARTMPQDRWLPPSDIQQALCSEGENKAHNATAGHALPTSTGHLISEPSRPGTQTKPF